MTCQEVDHRIKAWEADPRLDDGHIRTPELLSHVEGCSSCGRRYKSFLSLISRSAPDHGAEMSSQVTADKIMALISADKHSRQKGQVLPWGLNPWLAAAALIVVFASGYVFRDVTNPSLTEYVEFQFTFEAPAADSVMLVGTLPGYRSSEGLPMEKTPSGVWHLKVKLKKNEVYTYNFLVDGTEVFTDPLAEEVILDGFGGENALIRL